MSATDIALAVAAGAGGAAALGRFGAARIASTSAATRATATPATPATPKPAPATPADPSAEYVSGIFSAWGSLIATAGTLAGTLGAYQLTKDIGKGEGAPGVHWRIIASIAIFAVGLTSLIAVPVTLRSRTMASLTDVVKKQRWKNKRGAFFERPPKLAVPKSAIFGFKDVIQFDSEMTKLVTELREDFWEKDRQPSDAILAKLDEYRRQSRAIESAFATWRVRRSSQWSLVFAVLGLGFAVAGFANATYLINQGQRAATLADAQTTFDRTIEEKILDDALGEPGASAVLPSAGTDIVVSIPEDASPAMLGSLADALVGKCMISRPATIYDIGKAPDANVGADQTLFVVFARTDACPAIAGWVAPSWLAPAVTAPDEATTTTTAPTDEATTTTEP